jgi:leucyl aminopeptidase
MIVLEYKGVSKKSSSGRIGLVGKGITFDTGGISIKPSANMGYMKSDMAGGAAVIGAVTVAASLKLPLHIVGIIPIAENSVDACSIRPGDVISSYSGKTIEVIDTDAEGRLILADALSYLIKKYNPETIVDLATLTGNCIQILGSAGAGLFTKNDHLAKELLDAGTSTDEKLWALPLWEEFASEMQSDIADIKNLSTKPVAGAITAAKFLEVFTDNHTSWAHIDIAGVAFTDNEFSRQRNATAFGVALLTRFFENRVGKAID